MYVLLFVFCVWLAVGLVVSVRSSMRSAHERGRSRGVGAAWGVLRVVFSFVS